MKKIIVTGGSGFIGSTLVKFLLNKNYFVINIDKLSYSANPYNLKELKGIKNYKFFKQDINNRNEILKLLNRFKPIGIFNLAAETHVDRSIDDPKSFIKTNIMGIYNLLEALKKYLKKNKKKFKLVHISTDEVYGDIKKGKRSTEKFYYNPSSPYSASKASADHLIKSFVKTYKFPAIISNCCNNYGPNQFPEKLIPKIIYNIIKNKTLPIYGKGKNSREWIHVTKKIIKISKNNFYRLGKKVKIKFVKDRPGHDFRYALNCKKIQKELKWKAKINLKEGLENTFQWYINNKNFFTSVSKKLYAKRLGLK